jgi:hypothetical protein
MKTILKFAALAMGLAPLPLLADDSASIRLPLQNTGVDADATGQFQAQLKSENSTLTLSLANLTPGAAYTVNNGETPEAGFVADSKGKARLLFTTKDKKNSYPLDFDPRGQLFSVRENGTSILEAVISGEGEPSVSTVVDRMELEVDGLKTKAVAQYAAFKTGRRTFSVQLSGTTGTNWLLYVDGILRGSFTNKGSSARISFDSNPVKEGVLLLDFDPRGKVIDIAQDTNLIFSGPMAAKASNVNFANPKSQTAFIPSTAVDPDGTARVKLKVERDAGRKCSVELEDVPVGIYQLLVDGAFVANIQVSTEDDETEGEVEFSNRDDDSDELPLTFDPETGVFTVQRDETVYFQGGLTYAGGGTGTTPASLEEKLFSTGLDADAHAEAEFEIDDRGRSRFSVEIEDVAAGVYQLWVGGVLRGTITAELDDDEVEGEIEFESGDDDSEELPLDFDPRGLLIEVKNGLGTFFSHNFGSGSASNGTSSQPVDVELPLFNTGAAVGATAEMEFKRDDDGEESFEVELEDLPVGNYELWVGETQRATISVENSESGTHGEVEFEDSPKPGEFPLDFDPRGELVTVVRNGVTYFQRLLPAGLSAVTMQ